PRALESRTHAARPAPGHAGRPGAGTGARAADRDAATGVGTGGRRCGGRDERGQSMSNVEIDPPENECEAGGAPHGPEPGGAALEIITSREGPLGGPRAMAVRRRLPKRRRWPVGPWCFADHNGREHVAGTGGMEIPSNPHSGLQAVSWLFEGDVTHHDSGDHHALVRPGEV